MPLDETITRAGALRTAATATLDPPVSKYDFDTVCARPDGDSIKWQEPSACYGRDNIVAMGIADMDFQTAPPIVRAIVDRVRRDNCGYLSLPASYLDAIVGWNRRRYGLEIDPRSILQATGVDPALASAMRALAPHGGTVIVQPPTYENFYRDIAAAGCEAIENPLRLVSGRYRMDLDDLERRIDGSTAALILCNPQNPTGTCWTRDDLATLGEICTRRGVVVLADEIHCDFVAKGERYTPYSSLDDERVVLNSITFKSASKAFNLAALKCAYLFSANAGHLARVQAAGHNQDINTLGMVAHRAAYTECDDWLDDLVSYIDANMAYVEAFVAARLPLVRFVKPQATYLAWLEIGALADAIRAAAHTEGAADAAPSASETPEALVKRYVADHANVYVNEGRRYGRGGEGHVRMNVATSRALLARALDDIAAAMPTAWNRS
jgi:cystathionine beta-lyase